MQEFVNNFYNSLLKKAPSGIYYKLSLSIFITAIAIGCLCLLWLKVSKKVNKKSLSFIYKLYILLYFFDLCFSLCEWEFGVIYKQSLATVFMLCTIKFVALIALYGLICAQRWVVIEREKDALKVLLKRDLPQNNLSQGQSDFNQNIKISSLEPKDYYSNFKTSTANKLDINLPYILNLLNSLKSKNITDEEKSLCDKLEFELKAPPLNSESGLRIYPLLQKLVKACVKNGVSAD